MKNKTKTIQGLAIHVHHDTLVEYCYDYAERVKYIKSDKPKNEQKTRLRVFKILPKEAEADIPKYYFEADKAWDEAGKKWPQKEKDAFHAKWCGCQEWNGKELVFVK